MTSLRLLLARSLRRCWLMLEGLTPPVKVWPCVVRTLLESLDAKDSRILTSAIADLEAWPANTLAKQLRVRGIVLSGNAITRHRTGVCSCRKGQ